MRHAEKRLAINTVAKRYGITMRSLRYYEEIGILQSKRGENLKYREYDQSQLNRLEIILLLKRLSFNMSDIKRFFEYDDKQYLIATLHKKLAENNHLKMELNEAIDLLTLVLREIAKKPLDEINTGDLINELIYITKKTERIIPMDINENPCLILIGYGMIDLVQNGGQLLAKVAALRSEHEEKTGVTFPLVRIRDDVSLSPKGIVLYWNGEKIWEADYTDQEVNFEKCNDLIIEHIRKIL